MKERAARLAECCMLAALSACAATRAEPELKGSPSELAGWLQNVPGTVALTGTGEVKAEADRALVSLRVLTEHRSLQAALQANQSLRGEIVAALEKQGFDKARIAASRFTSATQYGGLLGKQRSYEVRSVVEVAVRSEEQLQAVAALADARREVVFHSLVFEHSDGKALQARALAEACRDAADRKRTLEETLGVKLTPRSIQAGPEAPGGAVFPAGKGPLSAADSMTLLHALRAAEPVSQFGRLVFSAQVRVEFAIQP